MFDISFPQPFNEYQVQSVGMTHKSDNRPRPHVCVSSSCARKFVNKRDLNRHMRKHGVGKLIKCSFTGCDYSSERRDVLNVHIRRMHMGCHSGIKKITTNRVRGEVDGEISKGRMTGALDHTPGIIPWEMLEIFGESEVIQQIGVVIKHLESENERLSNSLLPFLLEKYAPTVLNEPESIGNDLVCDK
jgi:hypothetical protein